MAAAGIGSGKAVTMAEIRSALGPLVFGTMINATGQLLEVMQSTFKKLTAVKKAFRTYAVEYFSSTDFTDFDFPETYGLLGENNPPTDSGR